MGLKGSVEGLNRTEWLRKEEFSLSTCFKAKTTSPALRCELELEPYPQLFPGSSEGKESACNAGDLDVIPGLGGSPGEGNGNPLQYPCLENLMDRGAWWATVYGVTRVGHD